ncbi:MAG: ATP phosphoribosyltransferase [Candidatus Dormibacteria bacterium]
MKARSSGEDRVRLALPNKGRLAQPSVTLVKEAGFVFEQDSRQLFTPCQNYPMDLLFVRAEDIGEYAQDGVVDLGITGSNLVEEAGARVGRGLALGFGHCRLEVAVPGSGQIASLGDLDGQVVATSHPRSTAAYFKDRSLAVRLIEVNGAVEVAPLLGVADAIVDLVATGTTLATNGLRPIATILESEAELIHSLELPPGRRRLCDHVTLMLASVIAGRGKKYLMMNAPSDALPRIRDVIPGIGSPSVMQLADPGMVAVHAVVDAAGIWELLAPLRDAGASSILVLSIEQLIP